MRDWVVGGGHKVACDDGTHGYDRFVGAYVVAYANGGGVGHYAEILRW